MLAPLEARCLGERCVVNSICQRHTELSSATKHTPFYSRREGATGDCPRFKALEVDGQGVVTTHPGIDYAVIV